MFVIPIWPAVISFSVLIFSLVLLLLDSKYHWLKIKTPLVISALFACILAYQAVSNSFGWAYQADLPDKFTLLWVNSIPGDEGHIDYFIQIANSDKVRLYEAKYTEKEGKQATQLRKMIIQANGTPLLMERDIQKIDVKALLNAQTGDKGEFKGRQFKIKSEYLGLPPKSD